MDGVDTAVIDPAVFDRNVAALRESNPAQAELIASLPLPETATPCRGRDGAVTFRIQGDDGREHWFGGTSAPTVSAPALLCSFDTGTGNVMLPGIGQGAEAGLLVQRLEPHRGVLVVEASPLSLAIALRLHDYEEALRCLRLAFILGEGAEAENRLAEFLSRHTGYCCPERLLIWPWQTPTAVESLRLMVERSATALQQQRAKALAEIQASWRNAASASPPDKPRVAVVARMAAPAVWQWAEDAATGGRQLGWTTEVFTVRGPADCHILRLAQRLQAFNPDWVLAMRCTRESLAPAVAPVVPVASWLDAVGTGSGCSSMSFGPADVLAVTSAAVQEQLPGDAATKGRTAIVPLAASGPVAAHREDDERPFDVVLLADVAPAEPGDAGINLHTQQVLWRESFNVIRLELDSFVSERAGAVLSAAEARAKMAIREPMVRKAFEDVIAQTLGPSVVAVHLAGLLAAAGIAVHVWGTGWETHRVAGLHRHGPLMSSRDMRVTFYNTKCYVSCGTTGEVDRDVLDAVDGGAVVLRRAHPADRHEGGIDTLFAEGREYAAFRTAADLVQTCKALLGDERRREAIRQAAAERLGRDHAMSNRLRAIQSLISRAAARE